MEELAADPSGLFAFAAFCHGLIRNDAATVAQRLDTLASDSTVVADAIVLATRWLPADTQNVLRLVHLIRQRRVEPAFVERNFSVGNWIGGLSPENCLTFLDALAGPGREHAAIVVDFMGWWLRAKRHAEGALADLSWECLGADQYVREKDFYDYDSVAFLMSNHDIERGFQLLEALLLKRGDRPGWMPIAQMAQNQFWHLLRRSDSARAIRALLSLVVRSDPYWRMGLIHDINNAFILTEDGMALANYACENEEQAVIICRCISSARSGFWPIALSIIAKYQDSEAVQSNLNNAILQTNGGISGWRSHLQGRYEELRRILADETTPAIARPWLTELVQSLSAEVRPTDE
jgi:hypothetical protein